MNESPSNEDESPEENREEDSTGEGGDEDAMMVDDPEEHGCEGRSSMGSVGNGDMLSSGMRKESIGER